MARLIWDNVDVRYYEMKKAHLAVDIYSRKALKKKKKQLVIVENSILEPNLGSTIDTDNEVSEYSCNCGNLTGKFNEDEICPICKTVVKETFMVNFEKSGFVDIAPFYVMTPIAYMMVSSVIGETQLQKIINYSVNLDIDGNVKERVYTNNSPYDNIGLVEFKKRFEEIILFYGRRKKKMDRAEWCIQNKKRAFMSKIPVLPPELRPLYISNKKGGINYDPLNKIYMSIVSNAEIIRRNYKKPSKISVLSNLYLIQASMKDLFDNIFSQKISGKHKVIRSQILGCRTAFSARMVIISLTGKYFGLDHLVISYKAFLGLYYLQILNCLIHGIGNPKFRKMTAFEIDNYLNDAKYSNEVDEDIYEVMEYLINNHKDGLWVLINRNPTMDLGSVQMLKIVHVIKNAEQYVMEVPLTSLPAPNADFDGDQLNLYAQLEKCVMLVFKEMFSPRRLCIDRTGDKVFNAQFGIQKDSEVALHCLTNHTYHKEEIKDDELRISA